MSLLVVPDFAPADLIEDALAYRQGIEDLQQGFTDRKKLHVAENHPLTERVNIMIAELLARDDIRDTIRPWSDHSWRCAFNKSPGSMEVGISRYQANGIGYVWHVDHADGLRRILNFVINLNDVRGGELQWCDAPMEMHQLQPDCPEEDRFHANPLGTIAPSKGQLVIMPSHYPHRVMPSPDLRITLHGHIRL